MKQTFSNKFLDWFLVIITFLFSIDTFLNLFNKFEYFSSYLFRITFALISITAFISLIVKNSNGEKYSRFFIIVGLIFPCLLIFNQFITDLIFYRAYRINLNQNSILYLKFIVGIILFILSFKYSKQTKPEQIKDYGVLISLIGIFLIGLIILRALEPNFITELIDIPIWKILTKTIIGALIFYFGYQLKNEKIKLKNGLIFVLISMFIYGLI